MADQKQGKNLKALGITIGVHALLLVALFLIGFSAPPPLPDQDLGMEVNLGTSDDGMGDEQPLNPNPPAASQPVPSAPQNSPAPDKTEGNTEELATQNEEEAPEVAKPVKPAPKPKEIAKTLDIKPEKTPKPKAVQPPAPTPPAPKPKPKAVFTGGTSNSANSGNSANGSNNSTGEGNTGRPGDRGVIGGDPNATGYTGTPGAGRGASDFNMRGRSLVNRPAVSWDGNETGYVAVNIKVDRDGNVTNATYTIRNSTINNPQAIRIAIDAAKRLKYNASPDAPEEQFGPIRFYFKAQ
ncbi:energy transducer TonB family protein [Chitinophaga niabensis]|uniref:Protein TonB, links inner and outer membranes n=1 Tax=Chitinophaga niabensis TaxID=536979 RepID=A0A1N6EVT4_9BACT|nr:energy transducer TonB [Chitinophaga niabensis]SIN87087.1 protein TonB, links inner and outer membranes [Chitinophaga niabensis]